jgi:putative ABC transport system permease protein
VLAIAEGFRRVMTVSGTPDVAVVLRSGADSELTSNLSRDEIRTISDAPGMARGAAAPLASAEMFVIMDLPKRSTGTGANVPLRGVDATAFDVRGTISMAQGRRFEAGRTRSSSELGRRANSRARCRAGAPVGQNSWKVVGIFTAMAASPNRKYGQMAPCCAPPTSARRTTAVYVRLSSGSAFRSSRMRSRPTHS